MYRFFTTTTIALVLSSGPSLLTASAADLGAPAPAPIYTKAPPPVPFSWTGFYIGANGGYGWAGSNDDLTYVNNSGATITGIGPGGATGGFGGGQIGYNYQFNWFVVGAEADFEGAGLRNSATQALSSGVDFAATSQDVDWFYTIRARAGFAVDRALVYFTGGYAGGKVADTSTITEGPFSATLDNGTSRNGYVLGGGLEYAFDRNWSAKIEYQYLNLGSETISGAVVPADGVTVSASPIKDQINTVRAGVNYHFGAW
jgi:outer membrane immunogenic protein